MASGSSSASAAHDDRDSDYHDGSSAPPAKRPRAADDFADWSNDKLLAFVGSCTDAEDRIAAVSALQARFKQAELAKQQAEEQAQHEKALTKIMARANILLLAKVERPGSEPPATASPTSKPATASTRESNMRVLLEKSESAVFHGVSAHPREDSICELIGAALEDLQESVPLAHAAEVKVVQPFVQRLLGLIEETARRVQVSVNKAFREHAATDEFGERCDWVFTLPKDQRVFALNTLWYLEAKTRERRSAGAVVMSEDALLREGIQQILKRMVQRFQLTGARTPHGIGAVINGPVIEFVRANFSGEVPCFTTGPLPLFCDGGCIKGAAASPGTDSSSGAGEAGASAAVACGGAGAASALAALPVVGPAGPSTGIPEGLRLLVRLMIQHDPTAFGVPEVPHFKVGAPARSSSAAAGPCGDFSDLQFSSMLGQGGFGIVARYVRAAGEAAADSAGAGAGAGAGAAGAGAGAGAASVSPDDDCFALKYSHLKQNIEYLQREAVVLRQLAKREVPRVPRLISEVMSEEYGLGLLMTPVGQPLHDFLADCKAPRPIVAARLWDQLLETLEAAHSGGIAHGDVRPSNIIALRRRGAASAAPGVLQQTAAARADSSPADGTAATPASAAAESVDLSGIDFVLIDWGLGCCPAAGAPAERSKTFGVPAFMADEVVQLIGPPRMDAKTQSWTLKPAHDMAALRYTCAAIADNARAEPPWRVAGNAAMILQRAKWIDDRVPRKPDGSPDWASATFRD